MSVEITPPFRVFFDSNGEPLNDGFIYVGSANLNPETNPVLAYWDEELTIPAAQPIRVSGGHPYRSGTPSRIYVGSDQYSILVKRRNGVVVYFDQNNTAGDLSLRQDLGSTASASSLGAAIIGRSSVTVESLQELASLPKDKMLTASLDLDGRSGRFIYSSADLSAFVSADSQQGIYVAPASDPSGASGAWVREYGQSAYMAGADIDSLWFGVSPVGSQHAELQAALDMAKLLGSPVVRFPFFAAGVELSQVVTIPEWVSLIAPEHSYSKEDSWDDVTNTGKVPWIKSTGSAGSSVIALSAHATVKNVLFVYPGQKWQLTSSSEPFNDTPTAIQLGDGVESQCRAPKIENCGFVGFKEFIGQHATCTNLPNIEINRVYGTVIETGIRIDQAYDIGWIINPQFNTNAVRQIIGSKPNPDYWRYSAASRAVCLKIGRWDGMNVMNPQCYGVRHFLHLRANAYAGDTNQGGGFNIYGGGLDVNFQTFLFDRSNNAIGSRILMTQMVPNLVVDAGAGIRAALVFGSTAANFRVYCAGVRVQGLALTDASIFGAGNTAPPLHVVRIHPSSGINCSAFFASSGFADYTGAVIDGERIGDGCIMTYEACTDQVAGVTSGSSKTAYALQVFGQSMPEIRSYIGGFNTAGPSVRFTATQTQFLSSAGATHAIVDHSNGRLRVDTAGQGLVLKSPDGLVSAHVTVDNSGRLLINGAVVGTQS